ncbi:MAG: MFS transporter, partial [Anaerolineales bacterium]|nr:MFS transporter [Anaerolineales bacterium]
MKVPQLGHEISENFREVFIRNRNLRLLFLANVGFCLGTELILILSPLFIRNIGASVLELGLVLSIMGASATVFTIPSGILADKFGRKHLIMASLILAAISAFSFTLVDKWTLLILPMLLFGASLAINLPAFFALITDNSSKKNRAGIFGVMALGFPVGLALGSSFGGVTIDNFGWNLTFYAVVIVVSLSIIPLVFINEEVTNNLTKVLKIDVDRGTVRFLITCFFAAMVVSMSIGFVEPLLPLYLTEKFAASKTMVGLFFTVTYLPFFSMAYTGTFADKFGRKKIMLLAFGSMAPLFIFSSMASEYIHLLLIYTTLYLFWSMSWPSLQALLMDQTSTSIRGLATGIMLTGFRVGLTLGPISGAYLWENFDPVTSFYASAA